MKILERNFRGESFEIEVKPQDMVEDVKKTIESKKGADRYPAGRQVLTHKGKILKDGTTMEENGVAENSSIFVLVTKAPQRSASSTSTPATTTSQPPPSAATPVLSSTPSAANDALDVYIQAATKCVAFNELEGTIEQILDMGGGTWDRDTVVRALHAAYNNPERAVKYLYSAILEPEELPSTSGSVRSGQAASDVPTQPHEASQPTLAPSTGMNTIPLNRFPERLPSMGLNADQANLLDFLRNNPQGQALRAALLANPHIVQFIVSAAFLAYPQTVQFIVRAALLAKPQIVQSIVGVALMANPQIVQSIVRAALLANPQIVQSLVNAALLANPQIVQFIVSAALLANPQIVQSIVNLALLRANPQIVQSIMILVLLDNPQIVESIMSSTLLANPRIVQSIVNTTLMANLQIVQPMVRASQLANPQILQSLMNAALLANPQIVQSIVSAALVANQQIVESIVNGALLADQQFVQSIVSAALLANPHIVQYIVRAALLANPHIVQSIVRLIQEHGVGFPSLLNKLIEGGGSNITRQLEGARAQSLTFTREENEAIERLEAMGFRRTAVLLAFLACNRSEKLTAIYLLYHRDIVD